MLLVNTDYISGKELETLGIVKVNQARQIAVKRMVVMRFVETEIICYNVHDSKRR